MVLCYILDVYLSFLFVCTESKTIIIIKLTDISLDRQASSASVIWFERLSHDQQLSWRKNHNLELYIWINRYREFRKQNQKYNNAKTSVFMLSETCKSLAFPYLDLELLFSKITQKEMWMTCSEHYWMLFILIRKMTFTLVFFQLEIQIE
jgi:hypothetical protein